MIMTLERFKVVAADVPTNGVLHDGSGYLIGLAVILIGRAWLDRNLQLPSRTLYPDTTLRFSTPPLDGKTP